MPGNSCSSLESHKSVGKKLRDQLSLDTKQTLMIMLIFQMRSPVVLAARPGHSMLVTLGSAPCNPCSQGSYYLACYLYSPGLSTSFWVLPLSNDPRCQEPFSRFSADLLRHAWFGESSSRGRAKLFQPMNCEDNSCKEDQTCLKEGWQSPTSRFKLLHHCMTMTPLFKPWTEPFPPEPLAKILELRAAACRRWLCSVPGHCRHRADCWVQVWRGGCSFSCPKDPRQGSAPV